jgi:pilus assembly protein CpaB
MKAARVVVLTVAVAAGGVAALLAGRSEKPVAPVKVEAPKADTVDVLVAKSDLGRGQVISPADVSWEAWPANTAAGNFIRKTDRPKVLENLTGMIVRTPFVAGEPIREAKLVNAKGSGFMAAILPSGMRAVATQTTPETGAGGFILPNDRVDVIMTPRGANDKTGTATSETILRSIRVLAIDQNVEEKNGQKVVVGKTATLELTARQAETLALSQQLGTLSLALRSIADGSGEETNTDDSDSRRNVNIVRFGVRTTTMPR